MVESLTKMPEERVLQPLYAPTASPDIEIQQQVARCLALFVSKPSSQPTLLRRSALQLILGFVKSPDALSQRLGTLAIGNLAVSAANHKDLFDQGAIGALLHLETASDAETRRCLAFAINDVAGNEVNLAQLDKMGILRTIIGIMERLPCALETRFYATFALGKLAMNATHQRPIAWTNPAVDATLALMTQGESLHAQYQAVSAMSIARTPNLLLALVVAASAAFHVAYIELDRELAALSCSWTLSDAHKLPTTTSPLHHLCLGRH
ncbi:hypothetical protein SPRG_11979 [Saprolegnia parasitica CBS 223.65]|uniref:Armadillo repeat-containing domain-containing protein n=1 Tax=Saprolegnia parasitica (strain CBS 223.65) TaxID=695850 RepID=A0A067C7Q6_SAPPC|nr:hypothetical protein SPRG_11979 [Saprolegnia parasitica CBS 223.65]KDO22842.1 hypothetical protein SPRG_11979 [Saprolegnia parasitica CBS 223.65]|eukprot:XP_012206399.1 hypothetical protein SPRG_11979 [Saprolegnia parasitica CBS 223.65]